MHPDNDRGVPRVSLGLPIYNGARFLRECLDSILAQTFRDFELIVCDNASTDETVSIVKEYMQRDGRISLYHANENRGAAPNFNWTFKLSRGDFFKWCAADDVLKPDYVERCLRALESAADAVMAYSGAVDIDETGAILREIYDNRVPLRFAAPEPHVRFQDLTCFDHSCIAVFGVARQSDVRQTSLIGPYVGSDRILLAELGLRGKILRVGDDLLRHREHPGRSVNEIKDLRRRTVWFDTAAHGPVFPYWRLLAEYFRVACASELPLDDKLRCVFQLARWIKWGQWRGLLGDLVPNENLRRFRQLMRSVTICLRDLCESASNRFTHVGMAWMRAIQNGSDITAGPGKGLLFEAGPDTPRFLSGDYERSVQETLRLIVCRGDVCYDIGANLGFFSLLLGRLAGAEGIVYAFEPVPRNASLIQKNARLNRMNNIFVMQIAVSCDDGTSELLLARHVGGAVLKNIGVPHDFTESLAVETASIDSLVARQQIKPPNVVKIDVEGSEMDVLRGMEMVLRKWAPRVVLEFDDRTLHGCEAKLSACRAYLEDLHYRTEILPNAYPGSKWFVRHFVAEHT
jgi:FkbM family methyltransferase